MGRCPREGVTELEIWALYRTGPNATALSWQLPVLPTESRTPCLLAQRARNELVYRLPLSEWKTDPSATQPQPCAISSAETTMPAVMRPGIA